MSKHTLMAWIATIVGIATFIASCLALDYIMGEIGIKLFDDEVGAGGAWMAIILLSMCLSTMIGVKLYNIAIYRDASERDKEEYSFLFIGCSGLILFLIQSVIIFYIFGDIRSNSLQLGNLIDIGMGVAIFFLCRLWYNSRKRNVDKSLE